MTFTLANLRAAGSFNGPMTDAPAAPRPTIQDYIEAMGALIPLAHDRAADISEQADDDGVDGNHEDAEAAWKAVEVARALMAGHAPDAAPAAPQTSEALAALENAEAFILDCTASAHRDAVLRDVRGAISAAPQTPDASALMLEALRLAAERIEMNNYGGEEDEHLAVIRAAIATGEA